MQGERDGKKADIKVKIKEQEVLQYELSSLRPTAVYKKQQNSNILFLSGIEQEMQQAKQNMENLVKEYQELEATSSGEDRECEGERDTPSTS
ncbi:ASNSD1 upstream open reading frame protein-like isoform X2 [Babylonia areolata]|uniref:ASNSD1 upstream open reading frame protein-like isoform X2 n=1 Tax=Babylonia areolata TaxID=304850 RepID=UPI003FD54D67